MYNQRSKLKITTSRDQADGDASATDVISHDSAAKEDEDDEDYEVDMQLRSKLKPKRRRTNKMEGSPLKPSQFSKQQNEEIAVAELDG